MNADEGEWTLPAPTQPLEAIMLELRGMSRGGLEQQKQGDEEEVKGLKFISNKLARLFDRNRRLKYSHISRLLIQNFSSESNDSRNIKRRVYDAINVMVASDLFQKKGDMLEKKESEVYGEKVEALKTQLMAEYNQRQNSLNNKRITISRLIKRKAKFHEQILRNKQNSNKQETIEYPIIINTKDNTKKVQLISTDGERFCQIDLKRSNKGKSKNVESVQIFKDGEYLQYL